MRAQGALLKQACPFLLGEGHLAGCSCQQHRPTTTDSPHQALLSTRRAPRPGSVQWPPQRWSPDFSWVLGAGGNVGGHPIPWLFLLSFSGASQAVSMSEEGQGLQKGGNSGPPGIQHLGPALSNPEQQAQGHTFLDRGGMVLSRAILERMTKGQNELHL